MRETNGISKKNVMLLVVINTLLLATYVFVLMSKFGERFDAIGTVIFGISFYLLATVMFITTLGLDNCSKVKISRVFKIGEVVFIALLVVLLATADRKSLPDFPHIFTYFMFLIFTFETRLLAIVVRGHMKEEKPTSGIIGTCFAYIVLAVILWQTYKYWGS